MVQLHNELDFKQSPLEAVQLTEPARQDTLSSETPLLYSEEKIHEQLSNNGVKKRFLRNFWMSLTPLSQSLSYIYMKRKVCLSASL